MKTQTQSQRAPMYPVIPIQMADVDPAEDMLMSYGRLFVRNHDDGRWYLVDDDWDSD